MMTTFSGAARRLTLKMHPRTGAALSFMFPLHKGRKMRQIIILGQINYLQIIQK